MFEFPILYPGYLLKRNAFGFLQSPASLAISVTHRCNLRCKTCGVIKKKHDELLVYEYERIFKSIGKSVKWVTITGGEPFLREDLLSILNAVSSIFEPKAVTIATNGYFTDRIIKTAKDISFSYPSVRYILNISIDGIGPLHNRIRNSKDSFDKAMETFQELKDVNIPNLKIGFHTVISKFNVNTISDLYDYLNNFNPAHHHFEIAQTRSELNVSGEDIAPSLSEYVDAIDSILSKDMKTSDDIIDNMITGFRRKYYSLSIEILERKEQVIPCYSGFASAQIGPNGDLWPCCVLSKTMGNLRGVNYDFDKVWKSKSAADIRRNIRDGRCYCAMANSCYINMLLNPATAFKTITPVFLKYVGL